MCSLHCSHFTLVYDQICVYNHRFTNTREDIRSNTEWPLEDVLVIHPGAVVHHEQQLHKATISLQIRANPFVVAVLVSQQDHNHM